MEFVEPFRGLIDFVSGLLIPVGVFLIFLSGDENYQLGHGSIIADARLFVAGIATIFLAVSGTAAGRILNIVPVFLSFLAIGLLVGLLLGFLTEKKPVSTHP